MPVYGDGRTRRDYTYVDDVVDGIAAALPITRGLNTVNLGGSQPVALSGLIEEIARACGRKPEILGLPPQPGDVEVTCADIRRARQLLGYQPRVSLAEGVGRFVAWYRSSAAEATAAR